MSGEPDYADDRMEFEERVYRKYLESMTKERLVDLVIQYRDMIPKHRMFVHGLRERHDL